MICPAELNLSYDEGRTSEHFFQGGDEE